VRNGNYTTGLVFIFIVGLVLYATRALTPTMLEDLLGYPVATTGLVTAPAGVGTMLAMLVVGRMMGRIGLRTLLFIGFAISAFALWQMCGYSLDLTEGSIIWPGLIQGIGTGLVFVPLSTATFATLAPEMRAQGTAIYSLIRNIGSSIGISLVQTMLVRDTVRAHAALAERITTANPAWHDPAVAGAYDLAHPAGVAALDAAVTLQATMIAYIDDFALMLILTLAVMPLILLIRTPRAAGRPAVDPHAVMD
jgi:DHA2 family multidrug resistance protein